MCSFGTVCKVTATMENNLWKWKQNWFDMLAAWPVYIGFRHGLNTPVSVGDTTR